MRRQYRLILFLLFLLLIGFIRLQPVSGELNEYPFIGEKATDFTLKYLHSEKTFTLSDNYGKKPTVLIFGSYT